jgi:hypothetical protein
LRLSSARPRGVRREVDKRPVAALISGALVVFLAQLWIAADAVGPAHVFDEVGHAGNSAFLHRGAQWQLDGGSYSAGWSILLVPLWSATRDPATWYDAALVVTGLAGVVVYLLAIGFLRQLSMSPLVAVSLAVALSLAPGRLIFGGYVLSENLIAVVYLGSALAVLRLGRRGGAVPLVALAALGGLATLVHTRLLPIFLTTLLFLLVQLVRHRSLLLLACLGLQIVLFVGGRVLNNWVERAVYRSGTRTSDPADLLAEVDWQVAAQLTAGQAWYGAVAWVGLPLLGLLLLSRRAYPELRALQLGPFSFLLLISIGTFAVSVLYLAPYAADPSSTRPDYFVYGRYLDPVWYLLSLVGLAGLVARQVSLRIQVLVAGLLVVSTGFAWLLVGRRPGGSDVFVRLNAAGIEQWPLLRGTQVHLPYGWALAGALVVLALLSIAARSAVRNASWASVAVAVVLAGFFAASSYRVETQQLRETDRAFHETLFSLRHPPGLVERAPVAYVENGRMPASANGYRYWLGDRLSFVSEPQVTDLVDTFVIARKEWDGASACGCAQLVSDRRWDDQLFVSRGELQEQLRERGWIATADVGETFPPSAYRSYWDVSQAGVHSSDGVTVIADLLLRHAGAGHPWPAASAAGPPADGTVRVVAWWEPDGRRLPTVRDLSRSIVPGDLVQVDVELVPPPQLPPGRYEVGLGLVHEGVRSFAVPGQEPVTVYVVLEEDRSVRVLEGPVVRQRL